MVTYYNMSGFGNTEGIISFWQVMSSITHYAFGYFLILIVFLIPTVAALMAGKDTNNTLNYTSLISALLSLFFYVVEIINSTIPIWLFALTYVITLIVRVANKEG